jgi:voltage-gated potassium channel
MTRLTSLFAWLWLGSTSAFSPADNTRSYQEGRQNTLSSLTSQYRKREEEYSTIENIPELSLTGMNKGVRADQKVDEQTATKTSQTFLTVPIDIASNISVDQKLAAAVLKEPIIEIVSAALVLLSSGIVAISTLTTIDLTTMAMIIRIENVIAYIFAIEFFIRWFAQFTWKGIPKYLTQPLVLVDLIVVILPLIPLLVPDSALYNVLPAWVSSNSGFINLRLLRVLRLQRVLTDMETFSEFQMALGIPQTDVKLYKLQLARVVLSIFTLVTVSSGLIYSTEHMVNPAIPDFFTALYFGLTTLTTVGFGDITPVTAEGKLVVCGSILAGAAVIPLQAAALADALLTKEKNTSSNEENAFNSRRSASNARRLTLEQAMICPNCNTGLHWSNANYCYSCGDKLTNEDGDWL